MKYEARRYRGEEGLYELPYRDLSIPLIRRFTFVAIACCCVATGFSKCYALLLNSIFADWFRELHPHWKLEHLILSETKQALIE